VVEILLAKPLIAPLPSRSSQSGRTRLPFVEQHLLLETQLDLTISYRMDVSNLIFVLSSRPPLVISCWDNAKQNADQSLQHGLLICVLLSNCVWIRNHNGTTRLVHDSSVLLHPCSISQSEYSSRSPVLLAQDKTLLVLLTACEWTA
jgi:hypothetical protein